MKKGAFYIAINDCKTKGLNAKKKEGYIDYVKDPTVKSFFYSGLIIGYDKRYEKWWYATELETGCLCGAPYRTLKEARQDMQERISFFISKVKELNQTREFYHGKIDFQNLVKQEEGRPFTEVYEDYFNLAGYKKQRKQRSKTA